MGLSTRDNSARDRNRGKVSLYGQGVTTYTMESIRGVESTGWGWRSSRTAMLKTDHSSWERDKAKEHLSGELALPKLVIGWKI